MNDDLKTKRDSAVLAEAFINQSINIFSDAWILMLCLGGLSDFFQIPELAIGYGPSMLIVIISVVLFMQPHQVNARLKHIAKLLEDLNQR